MQISMTGRHIEVTPALRDYVESRLERLERYFDVMDAQVTLTSEKYRQRAEMQLRDSAGMFFAAEETDDIYTAIDQAIERLESQAKKRHGKIIEAHHGRRASEAKMNFLSAETPEADNRFGPY
jgi:putative sigma-54 modulation protein